MYDHCPGPSRTTSQPSSRRNFLRHAGGGFGAMALASLLDSQGLLASEVDTSSRIGERFTADAQTTAL